MSIEERTEYESELIRRKADQYARCRAIPANTRQNTEQLALWFSENMALLDGSSSNVTPTLVDDMMLSWWHWADNADVYFAWFKPDVCEWLRRRRAIQIDTDHKNRLVCVSHRLIDPRMS